MNFILQSKGGILEFSDHFKEHVKDIKFPDNAEKIVEATIKDKENKK